MQHRNPRFSLVTLTLVMIGSLAPVRTASIVEADEEHSLVQSGVGNNAPEVYRGSFVQTSIAAVLAKYKVVVYPEDRVVAFPDPSLGIGTEVRVYRAMPVKVIDGGTVRTMRTWKPTVAELLQEQRVEMGGQDRIEPSLDSRVVPLTQVSITRVAESEVVKKEKVAFSTVYKDDADMEKGEQKEEQAGQVGSLEKVYKVVRENGVEISRVLASQKVVAPAVERVVVRGTKIVALGTGAASWYDGIKGITYPQAAHRTLPKGTKVKVVNESNGKSVVVTITDRGPYIDGRIIDLDKQSFEALAPLGAGVIKKVRLEKAE